ncbi:hypothetical protein FRB90_012033 [Tulasnella sp. 427]|nr:hypothetical protein FRB90_012033 [Tulasnella sp. 427]
MVSSRSILLAVSFVSASTALFVKRDNSTERNDGIHLAVGPHCGSAKGNATDVNEGLRTLTTYTTIVSFGDHHSKFRYAYVDFKYIWDGVLGTDPGYAAFGYTSSGACTLNSSTIVGMCSDPDHTFYWIPGHPSKQTHRIMADYVEEALDQC